MSYLNGQIGYRDELLISRSVIKKNNWALIEPDGIVKNSIPGYENCDVTILATPAMGASFADYFVTVHENGKNLKGIGGEGIETFLYVIEGELTVNNSEQTAELKDGGFFFSPAGNNICFENKGKKSAKVFLYRRRYSAIEGYTAHTVTGNASDLEWIEYEGMKNCHIKNLLPSSDNFGFDMNMHILKFKLGASHGYVETHLQEHGMYFLSGKAMYRIDDEWVPVKKGDYMFLGAYCPQACYAVGKEDELIYIYSKDCNREVEL